MDSIFPNDTVSSFKGAVHLPQGSLSAGEQLTSRTLRFEQRGLEGVKKNWRHRQCDLHDHEKAVAQE